MPPTPREPLSWLWDGSAIWVRWSVFFSFRSSIGARLVAGLVSSRETLLASGRALRYARSGDALEGEAPLVAVGARSVLALPNCGGVVHRIRG